MNPLSTKSAHLVDQEYLTTEELAERTKTHVETWKKLRHRGEGPRYVKIGRTVRYPRAYVEEYLGASLVQPGENVA